MHIRGMNFVHSRRFWEIFMQIFIINKRTHANNVIWHCLFLRIVKWVKCESISIWSCDIGFPFNDSGKTSLQNGVWSWGNYLCNWPWNLFDIFRFKIASSVFVQLETVRMYTYIIKSRTDTEKSELLSFVDKMKACKLESNHPSTHTENIHTIRDLIAYKLQY
jgi:hypothetical protein